MFRRFPEPLGRLAQYILDRRVPLEMCLLSNLHTGACASLDEHPFGMFFRRGFRVCLNTDDRLMSDTSSMAGVVECVRTNSKQSLHPGPPSL